jgi:glutathione S-transferase
LVAARSVVFRVVADGRGPWILGETFSAADIAIGSGLNFAVRLFKMVPARPAFQRARVIAAA